MKTYIDSMTYTTENTIKNIFKYFKGNYRLQNVLYSFKQELLKIAPLKEEKYNYFIELKNILLKEEYNVLYEKSQKVLKSQKNKKIKINKIISTYKKEKREYLKIKIFIDGNLEYSLELNPRYKPPQKELKKIKVALEDEKDSTTKKYWLIGHSLDPATNIVEINLKKV